MGYRLTPKTSPIANMSAFASLKCAGNTQGCTAQATANVLATAIGNAVQSPPVWQAGYQYAASAFQIKNTDSYVDVYFALAGAVDVTITDPKTTEVLRCTAVPDASIVSNNVALTITPVANGSGSQISASNLGRFVAAIRIQIKATPQYAEWLTLTSSAPIIQAVGTYTGSQIAKIPNTVGTFL